MTEELDPKEVVTLEELLMSNMFTQGALINLLEKNGLIKKKELIEEIMRLKNPVGKHFPTMHHIVYSVAELNTTIFTGEINSWNIPRC
jgi:hypothetical protein